MDETRELWPGEILTEGNEWKKKIKKPTVNKIAKDTSDADRYLLLISSPEELGEKLRDEREKLGKTQSEIGEILGISISSLSRMENGERFLSDEVIKKMGEIYGMLPQMLSHVSTCLKRKTNPLEQFIGVATEMLGVPVVTKILKNGELDNLGKIGEILEQLDSKLAEVKVKNR